MRLFRYVHRWRLGFFVMAVLGAFWGLVSPIVIDKVLNTDQLTDMASLLKLTLSGLGVYVLFNGLQYLSDVVTSEATQEALVNIRRQLVQRKLYANEKAAKSDAINLLSQDVEFFHDYYVEEVFKFVAMLLSFCAVSGYLILQNVKLGILFVILSLLRPLPQLLLNSYTEKVGEAQGVARNEVMAQLMDFVKGRGTILHNQANQATFTDMKTQIMDYESKRAKYYYIYNFLFFFNGITMFLGRVVPIALYFLFPHFFEETNFAALVAMFIASGTLTNPLQTMMYSLLAFQEAKSTIEKVYAVLDEVPESPQTNYVEQLQRLVCTDVAKSFDKKRILQDFNYTFEAGKHYLIRGASGSGKSTLLKLISKEETLDAGKIAVYDHLQHSFTDFTQNVGMIQQNPYLFNATIRENLSLGQDFQDEQLLTVLQKVGLDQEFPEGLDFQVEDNGKNVSGGQRVRLEIARFLLRQKDILLADEITAALDPANARKVRQLLLSLPIMIIEVAHYVDDLSVYDAVIDWEVA